MESSGRREGTWKPGNQSDLQKQFGQLTQRFPTPRLQTDDGYQEISDMHDKEDLLLENYSYVDKGAGSVRIPIDRAMELIAQPRFAGSTRGDGSGGEAARGG